MTERTKELVSYLMATGEMGSLIVHKDNAVEVKVFLQPLNDGGNQRRIVQSALIEICKWLGIRKPIVEDERFRRCTCKRK